MSEINSIYNYLTKSVGMSVGDAREIVNTIDVAAEDSEDEEMI